MDNMGRQFAAIETMQQKPARFQRPGKRAVGPGIQVNLVGGAGTDAGGNAGPCSEHAAVHVAAGDSDDVSVC